MYTKCLILRGGGKMDKEIKYLTKEEIMNKKVRTLRLFQIFQMINYQNFRYFRIVDIVVEMPLKRCL